jgi:ribosomal protein S18 acetylase RimI-like enzyme
MPSEIETINIRAADTGDLEVITDFNARLAAETEGKTLDRLTLRKGVSQVLGDAAKGTYLVATVQDEVVGQVLLTTEWSDWRNGYFWWIQSVYIRTDWRGRKVFTLLYEEVTRRAQNAGNVCGLRLYVEHENARAQSTYRKLGMSETSYRLFEVDFTRSAS